MAAFRQAPLDARHWGLLLGSEEREIRSRGEEQTLDMTRRLEALLETDGRAVCMTGTGDQTPSNAARYAYAIATGAEVLVLVHINGSPSPDYAAVPFGKWRKAKQLAHAV